MNKHIKNNRDDKEFGFCESGFRESGSCEPGSCKPGSCESGSCESGSCESGSCDSRITKNQDIVSKNANSPDKNRETDEISNFLSKIQNKYSGNTQQKHLNQMYEIGILMTNKRFNRHKLIQKLTKIIEERTYDPIKKIKDHKHKILINALKKGVEDGMSEDYRMAYNKSGEYIYNTEKLKKRAYIDSILDNF